MPWSLNVSTGVRSDEQSMLTRSSIPWRRLAKSTGYGGISILIWKPRGIRRFVGIFASRISLLLTLSVYLSSSIIPHYLFYCTELILIHDPNTDSQFQPRNLAGEKWFTVIYTVWKLNAPLHRITICIWPNIWKARIGLASSMGNTEFCKSPSTPLPSTSPSFI